MAALSMPQLETEQVTVQLTPFDVVSLVSVAVNACVLPSRTVGLTGESSTVIISLLLPQPEKTTPTARIRVNAATTLALEFMNTPAFVS